MWLRDDPGSNLRVCIDDISSYKHDGIMRLPANCKLTAKTQFLPSAHKKNQLSILHMAILWSLLTPKRFWKPKPCIWALLSVATWPIYHGGSPKAVIWNNWKSVQSFTGSVWIPYTVKSLLVKYVIMYLW